MFFVYLLLITKQITIKQSSMKLISKVTEIYCIADDFCKEYELELNKKHFRFQIPLQRPLKLVIEREE